MGREMVALIPGPVCNNSYGGLPPNYNNRYIQLGAFLYTQVVLKIKYIRVCHTWNHTTTDKVMELNFHFHDILFHIQICKSVSIEVSMLPRNTAQPPPPPPPPPPFNHRFLLYISWAPISSCLLHVAMQFLYWPTVGYEISMFIVLLKCINQYVVRLYNLL